MSQKILVVDDDLDTLRLVGMMLERQGYGIVAASNGQQALALARSEKPDLIVLDLMMPDIDGIQVARQLRSDPETGGILIVMFTAKDQMEEKLEGFNAGADDYLTKPIQPRELVAHVRAVLGRGSSGVQYGGRPGGERGAVIAMMAPKGGLGVSTLAINSGVVLHMIAKKPVIVADFRPGCGSLGLELGVADAQAMTRLLMRSTAAITPEAIEAELIDHSSGVRLLLSSADPIEARAAAGGELFAAIARQLPTLAAYTLLDLGPALTPIHQAVLKDCRDVVVVIEPVAQTIYQACLLIRRLVETGCSAERLIPVLINRQRAGMQLSLGQVQDLLGLPVAHVITAAPELAYQAQTANMPMVLHRPDGVAAQQYLQLAQKMLALAVSNT